MNKFQAASLDLDVDQAFAHTFGMPFEGSDGSFEALYVMDRELAEIADAWSVHDRARFGCD